MIITNSILEVCWLPRLGDSNKRLSSVKPDPVFGVRIEDIPKSGMSLAVRETMLTSRCDTHIACQFFRSDRHESEAWLEIQISDHQQVLDRAISRDEMLTVRDSVRGRSIKQIAKRLQSEFPKEWRSCAVFNEALSFGGDAATIWIKDAGRVYEFDVGFSGEPPLHPGLYRILRRLMDRPRWLLLMSGMKLWPI